MKIGSHNSMTFARPRRWWGWAMVPFARCQRKNLKQQFYSGCRCFDLRLRFDKRTGSPYFCHGLFEVDAAVWGSLVRLNTLARLNRTTVYVRLVLEDRRKQPHNEQWFRAFCKEVETAYAHLVFFQGNRKGDWKQVYEFGCKPELSQYVGSMMPDARWYEKVLPFAYALRCNRRNGENPTGDIAIYDFI